MAPSASIRRLASRVLLSNGFLKPFREVSGATVMPCRDRAPVCGTAAPGILSTGKDHRYSMCRAHMPRAALRWGPVSAAPEARGRVSLSGALERLAPPLRLKRAPVLDRGPLPRQQP